MFPMQRVHDFGPTVHTASDRRPLCQFPDGFPSVIFQVQPGHVG
jgi:hypothetical protein